MAIRKDWRKLVSGMGIILRFLVRYMPPENSKFHLTLIFFLANCKTFFFSADLAVLSIFFLEQGNNTLYSSSARRSYTYSSSSTNSASDFWSFSKCCLNNLLQAFLKPLCCIFFFFYKYYTRFVL